MRTGFCLQRSNPPLEAKMQPSRVGTFLAVVVELLGCDPVVRPGRGRDNIRLKGAVFVDLCSCVLYEYNKGCTYLAQSFWLSAT